LVLERQAPKRIRQIEKLIEVKEAEVVSVDEAMLLDVNANDAGKLMELTTKRNKVEQAITVLMEEWDELEALLRELS
jgi:ABC transporter C-terminal domain